MIYTLTLNPSVDCLFFADSFDVGSVNRSRTESFCFGGKGINVSAVLKELGSDSVALGAAGGFTGEALLSQLKNIGLKTDFVTLKKGVTRINVKIKSDNETELNAAGPEMSQDEYSNLLLKVKKIQPGDILIMSGSIPPGLSKTVYADIAKNLKKNLVCIIIDAAGEVLLNSLSAHPFLIKPNLNELEGAAGRSLFDTESIVQASLALQKQGAQNILVSLGADGALLLDENGKTHFCSAPEITAVNTVGAGDSMLAGFIAGLDKGFDYALKLAVASGTATASCKNLAKREDIEKMLARIK